MWVALAASSRNGFSLTVRRDAGCKVSSRAGRAVRSGILCQYVQLFVPDGTVKRPPRRVDSCDRRLDAGPDVGPPNVAYAPWVTGHMVVRRVHRDDGHMVHVVVAV